MRQFKILFTIFISSLFISSAYSASIENIQAIDNKTIRVAASTDVVFSDSKIYWDIEILRDIKVLNASKDSSNTKKISLTLDSDLYLNSSYSLIWVIWAEWNIIFDIWDKFSGDIINPNFYNEEKIIEKVVILNSRTIDVYYNYDITESLFEFKFLNKLKVLSLSSTWNNVLDVNLDSTLDKSSSYILLVWNLENLEGKSLELKESLYDFTTNSSLVEKGAIVEQKVVTTNLEEVSLNAAETPDSGAETWFVMLLTFIFSTMYFVRNKFKKA